MKFTVLGSGSTGNAVLISSERTNVLVDAGLSAKEILRRLAAVGVDPADLDAILITHEHSDHAGGLRVLLGSVNCPVYISGETQDAFYSTRKGAQNGESESTKRQSALGERSIAIESSREFRIGDIDFEPFSVPHDAADNFGFVAKRDGIRIATLMDFGQVTPLIRQKLNGCYPIVHQTNPTPEMPPLRPRAPALPSLRIESALELIRARLASLVAKLLGDQAALQRAQQNECDQRG